MNPTSILTVTTPAADRSLLTLEQLRAAVGKTDRTADVQLKRLGAQAATAIVRACGVRSSGTVPPTLRKESLSESLRLRARTEVLVLARRPVVNLVSVTENGTLLTSDQYELEAEAGLLYRLTGGCRVAWSFGAYHGFGSTGLQEVVVYDAGFDTVPDDLVLAAQRLVKHLYDLAGQESNVQLEVSDISGRVGYFHGPNDQTLLPGEVVDLLGPYKNESF